MLILLCGKMGSGKSTKAAELVASKQAILFSEDEWLTQLYPDLISSVADYVNYSGLIKPIVKPLVQSLLSSGQTVVMDFSANTPGQRAWLRSIFWEVNAPHELIYLDSSDDLCLANLAKRRVEQTERAATDTEEMFMAMARYFSVPSEDEGFNLVRLSTFSR